MKKKFALICMMICSLVGIFACNTNPYENLSVKAYYNNSEIKSGDTFTLNITEKNDGFDYDSITFKIMVDDKKSSTDRTVRVSDSKGFLNVESEYLGDGVTELKVSAKSYLRTGGRTLTITTNEGNQPFDIHFNINYVLNHFEFKEGVLKAVGKNGVLDLSDKDEFIDFYPGDTTQKDEVKLEVAVPFGGVIGDKTYKGFENYDETSPEYHKYAEVIDNKLVIYPTYTDEYGVKHNTIFPTVDSEMDSYGNERATECVTLKATYINPSDSTKVIVDYIDIEVVNECNYISLYMDAQSGGNGESGQVLINTNSKGEYDVALLHPHYEDGMVNNEIRYFIERSLFFDLSKPDNVEGNDLYNPNDYEIITDLIDKDNSDKGLPVLLSDSDVKNTFKVQAETSGIHTHKFIVQHTKYPGLFDKEIVVNFIVQDVPTGIYINDSAVEEVYDIYDNYARGFKVTYKNVEYGNYKYFVYANNIESLDGLRLASQKNLNNELTFGVKDVTGQIGSSKEGAKISKFANKQSFYLSYNLETLPTENITLYIGVAISMAADSYTDEIKETYFTDYVTAFPITINFKRSVSLDTEKANYYVDLTKEENKLSSEGLGVKFLELKQGQTFKDDIETITYDKSLISIIDAYNEETQTVSLYIKGNNEYKLGTTNVVMTANSGTATNTIKVTTYIPTAYAESTPENIKISMGIDTNSDGLLYYTADTQCQLSKTVNGESVIISNGEYTSYSQLIFLTNSAIPIDFFDYVIDKNDQDIYVAKEVNINSKVKVNIPNTTNLTYLNGEFITGNNVVSKSSGPITVRVEYTGAYEMIDANNNLSYTEQKYVNVIEVYIYKPLEGVSVNAPKEYNLYLNDILGIKDKSKSTYTITTDFDINNSDFGGDWNNVDGVVALSYEYSYSATSEIVDKNGKNIVLKSMQSNSSNKTLTYDDLFSISQNGTSCQVSYIFSKALIDWIENNADSDSGLIDTANLIQSRDICLYVKVYARQFNKIENVTTIKFNCKNVNKINSIDLDIDDDGVYFENRGQNLEPKTIKYTIDNPNAINTTILPLVADSPLYTIKVNPIPRGGNSSTIEITPNSTTSCGVDVITLVPSSNIKSDDGKGNITYFDENINVSFRIKVADGQVIPFEIGDTDDYVQMQNDAKSGKYYKYVITNDIDLSLIDYNILDIDNDQGVNFFELNGEYSYYSMKHKRVITRYSRLYNLTIDRKINLDDYPLNDNLNIGLFGSLNSAASIKNLNITNASIKVGVKGSTAQLNVGILAGRLISSKVYNSSVMGSIKIYNLDGGSLSSKVLVGGMVGSIQNRASIESLPVGNTDNARNNVHVDIDLMDLKSNSVVAGGLVGSASSSISSYALNNLKVVSSISTAYGITAGGVVGEGFGLELNNIEVSPRFYANINDVNSPQLAYGSIMGAGYTYIVDNKNKQLKIDNTKVYFVNIGDNYTWQEKANIYVNSGSTQAYVGGIIGYEPPKYTKIDNSINYTYVRSFYNESIGDTYKGNIIVISTNENSKVGSFVGGIANSENSTITSSYFDADITKTEKVKYTAFDGITKISNSYIVGNVCKLNDNLSTNLIEVNYNITTTNIYAVINSKYYISGVTKKETSETSIQDIMTVLDEKITYTNGSKEGKYYWFYNENINIPSKFAMPIILKDNKPLYDLVPTAIDVIINSGKSSNVHNISYEYTYNDITYKVNQILLFLNKTNSGEYREDVYEVAVDSSESAISLKLNGRSVVTTYVNIPINDKFVLSESSGNTVIRIVDNKIYPVSVGESVLTISNALDANVSTSIKIKVVYGITDMSLYQYSEIDNDIIKEQITGENNATVYLDEATDFEIINSNIIDNITYISGSNSGYIVEILGGTGAIEINGNKYKFEENNYVFKIGAVTRLTIKGLEIGDGDVKLKISPYIDISDFTFEHGEEKRYYSATYLDKDENSSSYSEIYIIDSLSKSYTINIWARANKIKNNEDDFTIYPTKTYTSSTTIETSNIVDLGSNKFRILENLLINDAKVLKKDELELDFEQGENGKYTHTFADPILYERGLLNFSFTSLTITKVNEVGKDSTYSLVFNYSIQFNKEYYRRNAQSIDLYTIENTVKMSAKSNENLVGEMEISFYPALTNNIFATYYTRGENRLGFNTEDVYPEENESQFIVADRKGLLKITLDQEFTDSAYIDVTIPNEYAGYVTLTQVAGIVYTPNDLLKNGDIVDYSEIRNQNKIELDDSYGIRLSKLSLNYEDNVYFNNTYFVQVYMISNFKNFKSLNITITSYPSNENIDPVSTVKKLTVVELPNVKVTVDNSKYVEIGKGIRKQLEIKYNDTVKENIYFDIKNTSTNSSDDYVYIADANGNRMVNTLSVDYLRNDEGAAYYLCVDVSTDLNYNDYTIIFNVQEKVEGVVERASCVLDVKVVDYEISGITINDTVIENGISKMSLKHGESKKLLVNIKYVIPTIGDADALKEYIAKLDAYFDPNNSTELGIKEVDEYGFAGVKVSKLSAGKETLYSYGMLRLYDMENNPISSEGVYGDITLYQARIVKGDLIFVSYAIRGSSISDDTMLQMYFPYYYNDNGELTVGESNIMYELSATLNIIITDNSTYDHPHPIETQEDLLDAIKSDTGHYILVNDIILEDWNPYADDNTEGTRFDSLDGNGYSIIIESFDFEELRQESTINAGIFGTISENTLLKNITVDISNLMIDSTSLMNNLSILENSDSTTYVHDRNVNDVDLAYANEVNFGILAGINNGAITNAKIINTNKDNIYLYVATKGYDDNTILNANIGGIVGINNGAISNSFVGLNINTMTDDGYATIEKFTKISLLKDNNELDEVGNIEIYPFVLASGNSVGGIASENNGVISNTYTKGMGIYNTYNIVENNLTGGFVAKNNNLITSAFVEGNKISNYRAEENDFKIESRGFIGGFVHTNNGDIENAYSNVYLETQSTFIGGFVFYNKLGATITNAYSAAINYNNKAHGQFTGVKSHIQQNFGEYYSCYYLVLVKEDELPSNIEPATPISQSDGFNDTTIWDGFSFSSEMNNEAIWTLSDEKLPRISSSLIDTYSFRKTSGITEIVKEDGKVDTQYDYVYYIYELGSINNPMLIENASNFDKRIIDNTIDMEINSKNTKVFGIRGDSNSILGQMNNGGHVRIVNNLNFKNYTFANSYKSTYLYEVIFAGSLDGNGMTFDNVNITTGSKDAIENFGLFAQIGVESEVANQKSVIKNLKITLYAYTPGIAENAGILAGKIVNSNIVNVKINGNNKTVSGFYSAGALSGIAYADESGVLSLIDIVVEDVNVEALHESLGANIDGYTPMSEFYDSFDLKMGENQNIQTRSFESIYKDNKTNLSNIPNASYAGGVVGVLSANNLGITPSDEQTIETYRTGNATGRIDNVVIRNSFKIDKADQAGGLFGYISENTRIKNCKFELSNDSSVNQLIKARNFAGAIVGENYGLIEKTIVAHSEKVQTTFDNDIHKDARSNGTYNLFAENAETKYTVAIGGIAGYSNGGVIIDSYSKVNVTKNLSFVAGGIIGYAKGYNYLGFVYNTGAVFAKYTIGGIIGFQVDNDVYMDRVVALTNWHASSSETNYKEEVAKRLYGNYKSFYSKTGTEIGYENFYIKMPEIGNLNITDVSNEKNLVKLYESTLNTEAYHIGSVVGKAYMTPDKDEKVVPIIEATDWYNKQKQKNAVFSNTLGEYHSEGGENTRDKNDHYNNSISLNVGLENQVSVSFRVIASDDHLNTYENILELSTNNTILDKFNFEKVFTAQEFTQQLLGSFSKTNGTIKNTANVFEKGYNETDRFNATIDTNTAFVEGNNSVWVVNVNNNRYKSLAEFSKGVNGSIVYIKNTDELKNAFNSKLDNRTYIVKPMDGLNNTITLNYNSEDNSYIAFINTLKSVFVGNQINEVNPKIIININEGSGISTIINALNNMRIVNLDFEINISNSPSVDRPFISSGVLANTLDGVSIENCNFNVVLNNAYSLQSSEDTFYSKDVGLLFGSVYNSSIKNSTFKFSTNENNIILNNSKIQSYGLLAGYISGTNIIDSTFTFENTANFVLSKTSTNLNMGLIAGAMSNVKYTNNQIISNNDSKFVVDDFVVGDNDSSNKNIGTIAGSASYTTFTGKDETYNTIKAMKYENKATAENINLSLSVGATNNCKFTNWKVVDRNLAGNESELNVKVVYKVNTLNIGAIVAKDNGGSSLNNVSNTANINIDCNTDNLNVGGLIGISNSNRLLTNTYTQCDINIISKDVNASINVGGMIGTSNGSVIVDTVFANDNIVVKLDDTSQNNVSVGGIIGKSNSSTNISNFSVISDMKIVDSSENYVDKASVYLSGVVGLNNGLFTGKYGFTFVELPQLNDTLCSNITNGSISSSSDKVYYAQEFVVNNYSADRYFSNYAMADLYDTISGYSNLQEVLNNTEVFDTKVINNMNVLIPTIFSSVELENEDNTTNNRYSPNIVDNNNKNIVVGYNVITENISIESIATLTHGTYMSGRNLEGGKVVLSVGGDTTGQDTKYLVGTNNGVISNVYFNIIGDNNAAENHIYNVALNNENYGLITNCYVYGISGCNYTISNTNNKYIVQSASAIVYMGSEDLYGIVNTNNENGQIYDCYSRSFGYSTNENFTTNVYTVAGVNKGYIAYTFAYIEDLMKPDNIVNGIVADKEKSNGKVYNSLTNSTCPSFAKYTPNIYYINNTTNIATIRGIVDVDFNTRLEFLIGENSVEELGLDLFKKEVGSYDKNGFDDLDGNYSYKFYFYSMEYTPIYKNLVIIKSEDGLLNYINSVNGKIPTGTIVLLGKDITVKTAFTLSLEEGSALLGIKQVNNSGTTEFRPVTLTFDCVDSNELIASNRGIIANINISNYNLEYTDVEKAYNQIAPIRYNFGLIKYIKFTNLRVDGGYVADYVAGMVVFNRGGILAECQFNTYTLVSKGYYNYIAYENTGTISDIEGTDKRQDFYGNIRDLQGVNSSTTQSENN